MHVQAVDSLVTFFEEKPDSEAYFAILGVDGNAKVCLTSDYKRALTQNDVSDLAKRRHARQEAWQDGLRFQR
jgi:hypothetical protein